MLNNKLSPLLFSVFFFACLIASMHNFLSQDIIAGWDLVPQYHLANLMAENLRNGQIFSYDESWFAGYPAFRFYAPLLYILVAALHLAVLTPLSHVFNFNLVEANLALNLVLFSLPFIFVFAFTYFIKSFRPKTNLLTILIFSFLYLFATITPHRLPLGLFGNLLHGHITAFSGLILWLFCIGYLERIRMGQKKSIITLILLLTAIILTHTLTTIFTCITALIYLIFAKQRLKIALAGFIAIILSAWWWLPFVSQLWLSSGHRVGLVGLDPLLGIFPGIEYLFKIDSLDPIWLIKLPYTSLLIVICITAGVRALVKEKKSFYVLVYLFLFILLPRDFLVKIVDTPIHYYRFINFFVVFAYLFAIIGFDQIFNSKNTKTVVLSIFLSLLVPLACIQVAIKNYQFDFISGTKYEEIITAQNTAFPKDLLKQVAPKVKNLSQYRSVPRLLKFMANQDVTGRIAIETNSSLDSKVGSPHLLSTLLPLKLDLNVVPGLLAESAYNINLINSTLSYGGTSIQWGRSTLFAKEGKARAGILKRLRALGVQYVISSSEKYSKFLTASLRDEIKSSIILKDRIDIFKPFVVFKISKNTSLEESFYSDPYILLSPDKKDVRELSETIWRTRNAPIPAPIIYSPRKTDLESLKKAQEIILITNKQSELDKLNNLEQKIYVIPKSKYHTLRSNNKNVTILPYIYDYMFFAEFLRLMNVKKQRSSKYTHIKKSFSQDLPNYEELFISLPFGITTKQGD